jgi:hypothetical protein
MKEGKSPTMGFHLFRDRGEDGDKLVAFIAERGKSIRGDQFRIDEQFEPVAGFLKFFQAIAHLGDELRIGASTMRFPEVGSDGSTAPEQLFPEHFRLGPLW